MVRGKEAGDRSTEFLLKDYEVNSELIGPYAAMRLGVLGASTGIVGILIGVVANADASGKLAATAMMLFVVNGSIRIVAAMNRNVFARCLHLASVERELDEVGFYRCWDKFIASNSKDTSSHAMVLAARTLDLGTCVYALFTMLVNQLVVQNFALWLLVAALVAGVTIYNEVFISHKLSEVGFIERLRDDMDAARRGVAQEVTGVAGLTA